jgi:hypothetical protein
MWRYVIGSMSGNMSESKKFFKSLFFFMWIGEKGMNLCYMCVRSIITWFMWNKEGFAIASYRIPTHFDWS